MVFVIDITQHHDSLHGVGHRECMEIEQYHLSFKLCQRTPLAFVVDEWYVKNRYYLNFVRVYCRPIFLCLFYAKSLQSLNGDVMQVLGSFYLFPLFLIIVISIPCCCYCRKGTNACCPASGRVRNMMMQHLGF